MACALAELTDKGVEALSLRAVGQRAGLTPMAVYRHFDGKDDLLRALGHEAFHTWRERIAALEGLQGRDWFVAAGTASVDFAFDAPALYDAAFILRTGVERIYPEDFRAGKSPVISQFATRLAEGQDAGWVRAGDPLELAMGVWGVLHGLIVLHRSGRFNMARADFTALCLRQAARICVTGDMS